MSDASESTSEPAGEQTGQAVTPKVDPEPPEGPGGPDAVPDWEAAGPDPVVPDPPRSAQVEDGKVPDEIETVESDEPDSAGATDQSPEGTEEPAD